MPELGEPISERELDVLNCLAEGASNREIADRLSISHNTVKVHVRNIFTKLGVSSRTEATTVALQQGMLSIPGLETAGMQDTTVGANEEAYEGVGATTEYGEETTIDGDRPDESEPAVEERAVARSGLSRRQILGIVGLLAILLLAVATSSLLSGNPGTPVNPAATADAEPTAAIFEETDVDDNWSESRPMPEARARMATATVGLNIYAIGGESATGIDGTVLIFDSQQRVWVEGAPKLTAVADAASAVLAGEIYVAGGFGDNGRATTAVEAYSPLNDAWRPVTALPRPVAGAVAIVSDGLLYVVGGEDNDGPLAEMFVYNPAEQQWNTLASMSEARTQAVGGVLGDRLYVVGGRNGNGLLASCEVYELSSESWSSCPPLQEARAEGGSAVFLDKFFVLGGDVATDADYGEVYDASDESWSTFEVPMLVEGEDWPALGVANVETHIYALGGVRDGALNDGLHVYRPLVYRFFIPAASTGSD